MGRELRRMMPSNEAWRANPDRRAAARCYLESIQAHATHLHALALAATTEYHAIQAATARHPRHYAERLADVGLALMRLRDCSDDLAQWSDESHQFNETYIGNLAAFGAATDLVGVEPKSGAPERHLLTVDDMRAVLEGLPGDMLIRTTGNMRVECTDVHFDRVVTGASVATGSFEWLQIETDGQA